MPFQANFPLIWPSFPFVHFLLPLLFFLPFPTMCRECPSPIFRAQRWSGGQQNKSTISSHQQLNPFHFYAITQDCQFVIARPDQLNKLSSLRILPHSKECHPSRVQFLWSLESASPSLLLLQKRTAHELCLLPVEMPNPLAIHGPELFIYSLRSALARFAKCSRPDGPPNSSTSRSIPVDPQLAFPDSLYSDLFYQLSTTSTTPSSNWTLHQMQISPRGHLHAVDQFRVQQMLKGMGSGDLMLLSTDPQRKRLFAVPKKLGGKNAEIEWTCPFDLIFRPNQANFHRFRLFPFDDYESAQSPSAGSILTGFSVDRHVAVFTMESTGRGAPESELFLSKLDPTGKTTPETRCVLRMPFAAKFGVISGLSLRELANKGPLPAIGDRVRQITRPGSLEQTTKPSTPLWHRYTNLRRLSTTPRPNRQTPGIDGKTQYFWHRSTLTTTTMASTTKKGTTRSREQISEDEGAEGWSEDYEEEGEKEEEEGEEEGGGGKERERILPLAEDEAGEEEIGQQQTPTPAQMISEKEAKTALERSGQIAGKMHLNSATFWSVVLVGIWLRNYNF